MLVGGIVALLLLVVAIFAFVNKKDEPAAQSSGESSITLYYRDGRTELWNSTQNPEWPSGDIPGAAGAVFDELKETYGAHGLSQGRWRVVTTLDTSLQKTAEEQVQAQRDQMNRQSVKDVALVAEDVTTGQIVALVNGLDQSVPTNTATKKTEVGTLALGLTYAALIEKTTTNGAGTVFEDLMGPLSGYICSNTARPTAGGNCLYNYDYRYVGPLTLRQALGTARLVPAVKAAEQIDENGMTATLQDYAASLTDKGRFECYMNDTLNQESQTACYTAAAHGTGLYATPKDMLQAYATLANSGKKLKQTSVLEITIDGKPAYEWESSTKQVTRTDTAYIIDDILADPSASYLANKKLFTTNGTKVSIMPGVTSDAKVGSVVQFSPKYAVGFWVLGGDQGIKGFAETATQPIAAGWMTAAHANVAALSRSKPNGIQELPSPVITFEAAGKTIGPSPATDIFPSWYKQP
jgi:penicillin-binding protein 1A